MKKIANFIKSKPNLLRAAVIALLIIIPLFPKFPILNVTGTYVAIRTEDFIIAAIAIVLLPYLWARKRDLIRNNLNFTIIVFLLTGFISLISAILITQIITPHLGFLHWIRRIEYFLPFFITIIAITSISEIVVLIYLLFGVGILVFLYGVGQLYFSFPVISTTNEEFSKGLLLPLEGTAARVNSTFAGQFDLAVFLAMILAIGLSFVFAKIPDLTKAIKIKIPIILSLIIFYWLLLQTGSRISFFAFLVSIIVVGLMWGRKWLTVGILFLAIFGLVFPSPLSGRIFITISQQVPILKQINQNSLQVIGVYAQVQQPISTQTATPTATPIITAENEPPAPGEPENLGERIVFRSSGIRFNVEWPRAWRAFLKNPLLGTGYSSLGIATDNDYLRALGETGALGFVSLLAIFGEIVRRIITFFKRGYSLESKIIVSGITGALVVMSVSGFFIDVLEASKIAIIFWILIGLLIIAIRNAHQTSGLSNKDSTGIDKNG